jgi:hypothetical protein
LYSRHLLGNNGLVEVEDGVDLSLGFPRYIHLFLTSLQLVLKKHGLQITAILAVFLGFSQVHYLSNMTSAWPRLYSEVR